MEYRIRVYAGENIYDFPLNGREQLSVGTGEKDDCRVVSGHIGERHLFFHKRNGSWFVSGRDETLADGERKLQEGEVFILDRSAHIAACVLEYHAEVTQKFKMTGNSQVVLGRGRGCDMVLPGSNVSRQHAVIVGRDDGWQISDNGSRNGTFLNQERLTEETMLQNGDVISIGDYNILYKDGFLMIGVQEDDGLFEEKEDAYPHWFGRAPRLSRGLPTEKIEIQNPPAESTKPESDWISILTSPLVMLISLGLMAVVTAASMGTLLIFTGPMAVAQIVLSVRSHKKQKKKYREKEQARLTKYGAYLDEAEKKIQSMKRQQIIAMQGANPSLEECLSIVKARDIRLWSRRDTDEDFMRLRIGIGESPTSFEVSGQKNGFTIEEDSLLTRAERIVAEGQTVQNVPITCDFGNGNLVGIVGERKSAVRLIKNLVMEAALHHSYEDVRIVSVYAKQEAQEFDWIRWLPHSFDEGRKARYIADSPQSTDALMRSFEELLKQRSMETKENENGTFLPLYLFVLTEYEYMEHQAVLKYLLSGEKKLGFSVIFAYDRIELLPKECGTIIEVAGKNGKYYAKENISDKAKVKPDSIDPAAYEEFARSMAPIRQKGGQSEGELPASITFLEGYGVRTPNELDVGKRWGKGRTDVSLAVPIGVKANGEQFIFDIHEKKYGPHGVVAGMTGSGKSEMVQSWILSMALKFSPAEAAFVLIDFKGTGLLLPFWHLPHLAGTISDLDNKIGRNLIALENELARRKALLDQYGANSILQYLAWHQEGKAKEPFPFLFIVIDEFAEFRMQFPDFTAVVEKILRIGRSLGVFAILMTQKPAGVVSDQMSGNINFRWCLRVANSADSKEMLHHADAAKITVPGRAYVQVGEDEVYELIQSFYSGARYSPEVQDKQAQSRKVSVVNRQGRRICYENEEMDRVMGSGDTEISKVVDYLADFVKNNGYQEADKIWMPKLPGEIYLEEVVQDFGFIDGAWGEERPEALKFVAGMVDEPASQRQYPLAFDLTGDGHISIFGAPGTGKTTMLQTMIMSLILHYTPEEVNIYLMDFGGWSLGIFRDFPHVGGTANDNDEVRLEKLVQMLERKLLERKMKFSDIGVGSLQAYMQATGEKLPYIVLALDNFAPVLQLYPDFESFFIQLTREGGSYGIYLLVTANSPMALGFKINQNIKMAAALQMTDKSDYQGIVGRTEGLEPEDMEGRGLIKGTPPLEFQAALPASGKKESDRVARIRQYAKEMRSIWKGAEAAPIPIMPEKILFGDVHGSGMVLGLSRQFVEPLFLPDERKHYMPIVGTGGGGKSNMIALLAREALSDGAAEVVIFSRRTYQDAWAKDERCGILAEAEALDDYMAKIVPLLQERKNLHDAQEDTVFTPVYIFIDDYKKAYEEMAEKTADRLGAIIRLGAGLNVNLYIAEEVDTFCRLSEQGETVCMLMARENSGILLGGSFQSYSVFSGDLGISEKTQAVSEYEGYLLTKGKATRFKAMKASDI